MNRHRAWTLTAVVATLGFAIPTAAEAQRVDNPWFLQAYGGYTGATGNFGDIVKTNGAIGGLAGYEVGPDLFAMGSLTFSWWSPEQDGGDDWTTVNYLGMFGYEVTRAAGKWDVILVVGGGATMYYQLVDGASTLTYPTATGGAKILFYTSPRAALTLDAMATVTFPTGEAFGTTNWFVPLALGVAFRI